MGGNGDEKSSVKRKKTEAFFDVRMHFGEQDPEAEDRIIGILKSVYIERYARGGEQKS